MRVLSLDALMTMAVAKVGQLEGLWHRRCHASDDFPQCATLSNVSVPISLDS
jgi:hypothetical protein